MKIWVLEPIWGVHYSCVYLPPGITVLLSLTVFMLLVAEIMPATSDSVPLIGTWSHCTFSTQPEATPNGSLWNPDAYFVGEVSLRLHSCKAGALSWSHHGNSELTCTDITFTVQSNLWQYCKCQKMLQLSFVHWFQCLTGDQATKNELFRPKI